MLKMAGATKAFDHLSRGDAARHYYENHGPLVAGVHSFARYLKRYTQYFPEKIAADIKGNGDARFIATAGLWFDNLDEMLKAFGEGDYMRFIRPDEERFLDVAGTIMILGEEHCLHGRRPSSISGCLSRSSRMSLFIFLAGRKDLDVMRFHAEVHDRHQKALTDWRNEAALLACYQTHAIPADEVVKVGLPIPGDYSVVTEFLFDGVDAAQTFTAAYYESHLSALGDIVQTGSPLVMLTRPHDVLCHPDMA